MNTQELISTATAEYNLDVKRRAEDEFKSKVRGVLASILDTQNKIEAYQKQLAKYRLELSQMSYTPPVDVSPTQS